MKAPLRHPLPVLVALLAMSCAEGAGDGDATTSTAASGGGSSVGGAGTGAGGTTTSTGGTGGAGGSAGTAKTCPPDEVVVGINSQGTLACVPVEDTLGAAIDGSCSIYVGWRDSCDGCTLAPSRWGRVDGQSCDPGEGASNTCSSATLAGQTVQLIGLNTGGDVGGDDKFYFGLHCAEGDGLPPAMGPCTPDQVAVGLEGGELLCRDLGEVAAAYVGGSCELFAGWRDSCGSCGLAPAKWGRVGTGSCSSGAGADNTCTTPTLGTATVDTFGLNTDGDVNDDDKFYFGLGCAPASPNTSTADGVCPIGEVMVGVEADGSILCESLAPMVQAVFESDCYLYAGWRDSCGSCSSAPARWGRVSVSTCENGLGGNNTCTTDTLGGTMLHLFGLNTGGDVNDDDKFYFGLRCGG